MEEISSLPGVCRYGVNQVVKALRPVVENGLKSVLLFGVPSSLPKVGGCIKIRFGVIQNPKIEKVYKVFVFIVCF